jgi:hypothetical protein
VLRVVPRGLMYGGWLALEQFHFSSGILVDNMVGSAATPDATIPEVRDSNGFADLSLRMLFAAESMTEKSARFSTEDYLA